ncbi:MAG: hypothetical protein ACXV74_05130 [Methylobacter sp.]
MRIPTSFTRILVVLGVFIFSAPAFSLTPEPETKKVQQGITGTEDVTAFLASKETDIQNRFGKQIAGTYLVTRQAEEGPSRILNIFADGNLTSIQSTQFGGVGEALGGDWFSNQHGAWERVGKNQIEAIVLNLAYEHLTGKFLGTAIAHYNLKFDNTLQTMTGSANGKIYSPGVDPQNPGETKPIAEFSDDFQAHRVTVGN